MTLAKLKKELVKKFKLEVVGSEEFDGRSGGLWIKNNPELADEYQSYDYNAWSYDSEEKHFTMGVHNDIYKYLNKNGYFAEFYDSGTLMIYEA